MGAVSAVAQTTVAATESPCPSSTRACGLRVSYSSRLSGALTSSAITRLKSAGPNLLQATAAMSRRRTRSEEHTSELQSPCNLVCRLLLEKKKKTKNKD